MLRLLPSAALCLTNEIYPWSHQVPSGMNSDQTPGSGFSLTVENPGEHLLSMIAIKGQSPWPIYNEEGGRTWNAFS